jgi:hypothetical protein
MMKKIALILALLLTPISAFAATTPNSFVTPQTPNRGIVRFLQGTDAPFTFKVLYTAGANGSRCYAMMSSNNDSVTHPLVVAVFNGGVIYNSIQLTSVAVAGNSAGVPPQNLMAAFSGALPVDQNGNPFIQLISGDTLQMEYGTALTTSDYINAIAFCSDY